MASKRQIAIRFSPGPELEALADDDGAHVVDYYAVAARDRFARLFVEEYTRAVCEELARQTLS